MTAMTAAPVEEKRRGPGYRLETIVAIVISVAGLMTSWASYQSALWDGIQTIHYNRASAARVMATRASLDASVARTMQVGLFNSWMQAKDDGNARMAAVYERRFPPEFLPAFKAWRAMDPSNNPAAPPSPFRMPQYRESGLIEANDLTARAEREFRLGEAANKTSDSFTRSAVVLAMAMFFGGITQAFASRGVRVGLAIVAAAACVAGLVEMFSLSTAKLG